MKSFLSIFLICYFSLAALVPRMDFDRLNTIPDLVAHFLDHEDSDDSPDLIEFVKLHYGRESEKPADGHELPFQKHDCCVSCCSFASFLPGIYDLASVSTYAVLKSGYSFPFTSKHISDIWLSPTA